MIDKNLASVCGLYCGACQYIDTQCKGCGNVLGRPFWTAQMELEVCPIYDCCINKKQLEHCGLCSELPCKTFTGLRDPSLSDEEAERALIARKNDLLRRRGIGTKEWLEEKG
ncbi:MAG: DUF3795 domain-containing protein [Halobacteriota archaeon]|nr:DUF3795 domain-containing protein [Halobacteriota archaeon]